MIKISSAQIPVRKNRIIALIIHYSLKVVYFLYCLFRLKLFCKYDKIPVDEIEKVLVIRADSLGDIAMSSPAFKGIRLAFPDSHITLLVATRSKQLVEDMSTFDKIIYFDAPWMTNGGKKKFRNFLKATKNLRKLKFDLSIDLRGDFRNNIFMRLLGIKYRMGFDITGCGFLLTHIVPCGDKHHSVDLSFSLNTYLGVKNTAAYNLSLPFAEDEQEFAADFLKQNGNISDKKGHLVAIIHPGAKWYGRRWESQKFAQIADLLIEKANAIVILAGSSTDLELVEEIASFMKRVPIIAAGKMSLKQFLYLLEKCDIFIGLDSGPVHLAATMRRKLVALYGPASPEAVGPYGDENIVITKQEKFSCSPCAQIKCKKPDNSCMDAITVNDVWQAVQEQIDRLSQEGNIR